MTGADGVETEQEVRHGSISVIKLPQGQAGTLHLTPLSKFDVGMGGFNRGGTVKVIGGTLGVVIDARGRPLRLTTRVRGDKSAPVRSGACGHAEARTSESEPRHRRQFAAGVGPRQQ